MRPNQKWTWKIAHGRLRVPTGSTADNDDSTVTPLTHMRKKCLGDVDDTKHVGSILLHESIRPEVSSGELFNV